MIEKSYKRRTSKGDLGYGFIDKSIPLFDKHEGNTFIQLQKMKDNRNMQNANYFNVCFIRMACSSSFQTIKT